MTKTQQSTGVLQIDSQARSLIESAAILRAQVVAKQVQIEGMRSFATEDNPELILAKQELAALQSQLQQVAGSQSDTGSDINLSKGRVTQSGMEYLRRFRDLKYQETVYELLAKEFEVAKLDEAREGSIIQVVDAAVPRKEVFSASAYDCSGEYNLGFFCCRVLGLAAEAWTCLRAAGESSAPADNQGVWKANKIRLSRILFQAVVSGADRRILRLSPNSTWRKRLLREYGNWCY